MSEPVRFLLAMPWGRVGSQLLAGILSRSVGAAGLRMGNEELTVRPAWSAADQMAWLDEHFALSGQPVPEAIGHIGSKESAAAIVDRAWFSRRCAEGALRIVRMRRADHLRAAISQVRAKDHAAITGRWSIGPDEPPPGPTTIDPARLLEVMEAMVEADRALGAMFAGCAIHDVEYADLLGDLDSTVRGVRAFLDIAQRAVPVTHAKMTPDDLAATVLNLDEIRAVLRGTPHEVWLGR